MGMIQNMMSELGAGGMGDSDDDSDDNQSGNFFVVEARPSKFSQFKICRFELFRNYTMKILPRIR